MNYLIKNKHWKINKDYDKEKLLYLLIDRPTEITYLGSFIWENKEGKKLRNYDLPSLVWYDGGVCWCVNNKNHRKNNKPAVIWSNGYKEYWLNHKQVK